MFPPYGEIVDAVVKDLLICERGFAAVVGLLQRVEEGRMGVRILASAGIKKHCQLLKPFLGIPSSATELFGHCRGSVNECERERISPIAHWLIT